MAGFSLRQSAVLSLYAVLRRPKGIQAVCYLQAVRRLFLAFYISYHLEPLLRRAKGLQAQGLEAVLRRAVGHEAVLRRPEGL